jgi:cell filamentation protein
MARKKKIQEGLKYRSSTPVSFQPDSRKRVLRNKAGITSAIEMSDRELLAYREAAMRLSEEFSWNHSFTAGDIQYIHRVIFGEIYEWAGEYRNVKLSKDEFVFARAKFIPDLMEQFSEEVLKRETPPKTKTKKSLARLLAKIHVELVLIHPFREGNGRTIRLLLHLIAQQAGFSGMDFSSIEREGTSYNAYIGAIHEGMKKNYVPMASILLKTIV